MTDLKRELAVLTPREAFTNYLRAPVRVHGGLPGFDK